MAKVEIVPLERQHVVEWYGADGTRPTVKGIAGFVDGQLVAIAGLMFSGGNVIAFCNLKDEARPYRTAIHRTAVRIITEAKRRHRRIIAYCEGSEPTAPKWLSRLGFVPEDGDIWAWQN